jgi:lipopolysaccharide/colanic/teichoic acid biosynthesis glycosyltransferase
MNSPLVNELPYYSSDVAALRPVSQSASDPLIQPRRHYSLSPYARDAVSHWALSGTRRAIDFLIAVFALIALAPVMLVVAIAVRLGSEGPALFKQERMGRNGRVFTLYKFRSMTKATSDGSPITVTGDSRITRIGAFLRKYKVDELPQFWNVLKGEMSLIGPRPKLPHHEALYMPFRPGITGAATLAFRHEEEMLRDIPREHLDCYYDLYVKPCKAKIDWEYMQYASLWTDLEILWRTAKACVSKDRANQVELPVFTPELVEEDFSPSFSYND